MAPPALSDQRLDQRLGNLLRGGVILAGFVVILGGAHFLWYHGGEPADYSKFYGEPPNLCSVPGILADAWVVGREAIIQLGILLLIATPVARVLFSVFAFAVQRDRTYVIVTLLVLGVLLYSLFTG